MQPLSQRRLYGMIEAFFEKGQYRLSPEENDPPKSNCRRTEVLDGSVRYATVTVRQEDHDRRSELQRSRYILIA